MPTCVHTVVILHRGASVGLVRLVYGGPETLVAAAAPDDARVEPVAAHLTVERRLSHGRLQALQRAGLFQAQRGSHLPLRACGEMEQWHQGQAWNEELLIRERHGEVGVNYLDFAQFCTGWGENSKCGEWLTWKTRSADGLVRLQRCILFYWGFVILPPSSHFQRTRMAET